MKTGMAQNPVTKRPKKLPSIITLVLAMEPQVQQQERFAELQRTAFLIILL